MSEPCGCESFKAKKTKIQREKTSYHRSNVRTPPISPEPNPPRSCVMAEGHASEGKKQTGKSQKPTRYSRTPFGPLLGKSLSSPLSSAKLMSLFPVAERYEEDFGRRKNRSLSVCPSSLYQGRKIRKKRRRSALRFLRAVAACAVCLLKAPILPAGDVLSPSEPSPEEGEQNRSPGGGCCLVFRNSQQGGKQQDQGRKTDAETNGPFTQA